MASSSEQARLLLELAYHQTRSIGLRDHDLEDCAMGFIHKVILEDRLNASIKLAGWLERCARNYAYDYKRAQLRLQKHEAEWPVANLASEGLMFRYHLSCQENSETQLLRNEAIKHIEAAINMLLPCPREMLIRHHIHGESIQEIVVGSGRTQHAIEQMLLRARRRVRENLIRKGLNYSDLILYISLKNNP